MDMAVLGLTADELLTGQYAQAQNRDFVMKTVHGVVNIETGNGGYGPSTRFMLMPNYRFKFTTNYEARVTPY
jgi:hypothetical protein